MWENKCMMCVTGGEASTGGGRMGCVVYAYMEVISVGFTDPLDHPHPSLQKASSCWLRGLFVFAFCNEMPSGSIGCAAPALLSLWQASWIWQHPSCIFSPHWIEADSPRYIFWCTAASHWPRASQQPSPSLGSWSILMRRARLCFLHLLVVLWSFGVGGEGCRPDIGSRNGRRRRLQPCQFAVSWTVCEKPAMAMSLSADDEDYDSDSEQVSTLKPLQAGIVRPPEECLCQAEWCAASQDSEEMELPGEKCIDSLHIVCLLFDFFALVIIIYYFR